MGGHGHDHGAGGHTHNHAAGALRAGARFQRRLAISFVLIAVLFVVEAVAGFLTNSLALLSDAGHMLTDVVGLGMALAAIQLASRHAAQKSDAGTSSQHTFGLYRLEILAAFVNALLLFGVAIYVLIEAVRRVGNEPEVLGVPMLIVAGLGFAVNIVAFLLLREGSKESVNVEGAYLEVLADTVGSAGVIIAAILLEVFEWTWVDPVVGALIGLWILPRTFRLGRQAVRILLQSAPPGLDVDEVQAALAAIPDVVGVHDLHVWTLTSDMENASAHLVIEPGTDSHAVLDRARDLLAERYGISHATLQLEPSDHHGCEDLEY